MIRFRMIELLREKSVSSNQRIDWGDVAIATGIHRTTLSKINNTRGYNVTSSNIDRLCKYFNCGVGDLMVYVPDDANSPPVEISFKGPRARTIEAKAGAMVRHARKTPKGK
jgi:putative transcriptional regulator